MSKIFYTFLALIFFALNLSAHPLGNFSFNQYSRLEVEGKQIKIRQILDLAEIPTFQEQNSIDADKNGTLEQSELEAYTERITPQILANLFLTLNNQPLELKVDAKHIELQNGAGDLPTLKIRWDLHADLPKTEKINQIRFENKNYAERIGWNEIVASAVGNTKIFDSTAFGSSETDELKSYPQETLEAPLTERTAQFSFSSGAVPENAKLLQNRDGHTSVAVQRDRFAELIAVKEVTFPIIAFGLLLAFGFGALHALSPGHGKAVVGAYLVGSRGTAKHAMFLGLTVTITHTLGVFALGIITLFASEYILPERLMPFLSFVSGLLVLYIGLTMFKSRLSAALGWENAGHKHGGHSHADNDHENKHEHKDEHSPDGFTHAHDGHTHSHVPPENISWKNLLALGISGGLLPCPSALVLMLSAISYERVAYGLLLTLVFSFGLAATLTFVGLAFLYAGKTFGGSKFGQNKIFKALPVFSALFIAVLGAVICYNSI